MVRFAQEVVGPVDPPGEGQGTGPTAGRWRRHAVLAAGVRGVVVVLPAAAGAAVGMSVAHAAADPGPPAWVPVMLGAAAAVLAAFAMSRLSRGLVPLGLLLRLALVFPDRAPARFRIALRAGNVRRLRAWVDAQLAEPVPATAAHQLEAVLTLAAALNAHDRRTRGHSDRVRALTDLIAEQLGLADEDRFRLRWAALLHDIGKLAVPAEILNKRGRLEPAEWDVLRGHPNAGHQLAEPLRSWLGEWAQAIDQHHERFDGTGYPRSLQGHEISLAGRIVSATDAFETMTAVRAYKRALSVPAARRELVRCAGSHFDPRIVRAFLDVSVGRLRWTLGLGAFVAPLPVVSTLIQTGARAPLVGAAPSSAPASLLATLSLTAGLVLAPPAAHVAAASRATSARGPSVGHPAERSARPSPAPPAPAAPASPAPASTPHAPPPAAAPSPPPLVAPRLPPTPPITLPVPPVPDPPNLPQTEGVSDPTPLVQLLEHDVLG